MALSKLKIRIETSPGRFTRSVRVMFNPNSLSIQKSARWRQAPAAGRDVPGSQFTYSEPATLDVELLFDTYGGRSIDIRGYTREIFHLATVERHGDLHRPPLCKLLWGRFDFDGFTWVLQRLSQKLTLFLADGTPVRATLGCSFRQWRSDRMEVRLLNRSSADLVKTRIVHRGDTLSSIAAEAYGEAGRWRPIAEANGIHNPRRLEPGRRLKIPRLRDGRRSGRP